MTEVNKQARLNAAPQRRLGRWVAQADNTGEEQRELPSDTKYNGVLCHGTIPEVNETREAVCFDVANNRRYDCTYRTYQQEIKYYGHFYSNGILSRCSLKGDQDSPQNSQFTLLHNTEAKFDRNGKLIEGTLKDHYRVFNDFVLERFVIKFDPEGWVKSGKLLYAVKLGDVDLPAKTTVKLNSDASIISFKLQDDMTIKRISFKRGNLISIDRNGNLKYVKIGAENQEINRSRYNSGDQIWFGENNTVAEIWLSHDNSSIKELSGVTLKIYSKLKFLPGGKLDVHFSEDTDVKGVMCKGREWSRFYGNGQLEYTFIGSEYKRDGHAFPMWTKLFFSSTGSLDAAHLSGGDASINGVSFPSNVLIFPKDSHLEFNIFGKVKMANLGGALVWGNSTYPAGTKMVFYVDGKVEYAKLGGAAKVKGADFPAGTEIWFKENGDFKTIKLQSGRFINASICKNGSVVNFGSDNQASSVLLSSPCKVGGVNGVEYPTGTLVEFHSNKKIKSAWLLNNGMQFKGMTFPKMSKLSFDLGGVLTSVKFGTDATVDGKKFPAESELFFTNEMKLRSVITGAPYKFGNYDLKVGTKIWIVNNIIKFAELKESHRFGKINVPGNSTMSFDRFGRMDSVILNRSSLIEGEEISEKSVIKYQPNGKPASIKLGNAQRVQGVPCTGTVEFHQSGKLKSGTLSDIHTFKNGTRQAGYRFVMDEEGNVN